MDFTNYAQMVVEDLKTLKMNKQQLTEHYAAEQKKIRDMFGGNISDVPVNYDEYWQLNKKLHALGGMTVA